MNDVKSADISRLPYMSGHICVFKESVAHRVAQHLQPFGHAIDTWGTFQIRGATAGWHAPRLAITASSMVRSALSSSAVDDGDGTLFIGEHKASDTREDR